MTYQKMRESLMTFNRELHSRHDRGNPLTLNVDGRPQLHILSFDPLAYEAYGTIRNRAPYITGSLALRAFLFGPHPDGGARVYAGMQAEGGDGYGYVIDGHNGHDREVVNGIARSLGHPEFRLT